MTLSPNPSQSKRMLQRHTVTDPRWYCISSSLPLNMICHHIGQCDRLDIRLFLNCMHHRMLGTMENSSCLSIDWLTTLWHKIITYQLPRPFLQKHLAPWLTGFYLLHINAIKCVDTTTACQWSLDVIQAHYECLDKPTDVSREAVYYHTLSTSNEMPHDPEPFNKKEYRTLILRALLKRREHFVACFKLRWAVRMISSSTIKTLDWLRFDSNHSIKKTLIHLFQAYFLGAFKQAWNHGCTRTKQAFLTQLYQPGQSIIINFLDLQSVMSFAQVTNWHQNPTHTSSKIFKPCRTNPLKYYAPKHLHQNIAHYLTHLPS